MNIIAESWRGEISLRGIFWGGIATNMLLNFLIMIVFGVIQGDGGSSYAVLMFSIYFYMIFNVLFAIWWSVSVWRCAEHSGMVAKSSARFTAFMVIMYLIFIFVELFIDLSSSDPVKNKSECFEMYVSEMEKNGEEPFSDQEYMNDYIEKCEASLGE